MGADATTHDLSGSAPVRWTTTAPPERVWSVIEDGWTYAAWVVGASRVRSVDESWPAEGTQLHHSVGVWPLVRNDRTSVVEVDPARMRIVLRARVRPFGTQLVEIDVASQAEGSVVTMREDASGGLAVLAPRPLRQVGLTLRNREALRRLCLLAERETHAEEA
ncbi:SRPBCC family protein [Janibacter limosus]|uniref:SRPBCC family protein n=1 Tax=Janibacter limosus TaxID=53458 RepID=UPI0008329A79|nr:SRPBCC family protein [Janibacter limosus]